MERRWWAAVALCSVGVACGSGQTVVGGDAGADTGSPPDVPLVDAQAAPDVVDVPPGIDVVDVPPSIDASDVPPADVPPVDVPFRCTDNASCAGNAGGAVCDTVSGRCVACVATADTCPTGQYCVAGTNTCTAGCRNDEGCATAGDGGAATRHCDTATHACFDCLTDAHCPSGTLCVGNVCVAGCNAARPCPASQTCCGGACVDPQSNVAHCGACDARCSIANGTAACMNGTCAVGTCTAPNANCDANATNGCETDTSASVAHCGGCAMACAARPHSVASCASARCAYACETGFADCDLDPSNGCEVDLTTTATHCGLCGNVCALANGTAVCTAGRCAIDVCSTGFGNCDGNAANGCETDTRTNASHCGACAAACPTRANAVPACTASACSSVCVAGYSECNGDPTDGCETNFATSAAHCGGCGRSCLTANVATATCAASACTITSCAPGFADCDGNATNGCEASLATSAAHCGACGRTCLTANVATATCAANACTITSCAVGFADCNSDPTDGCETSLTTSAAHCGACGRTCLTANVATATCAAGACTVTGCATGFGNCDGNATNGCELDTRADVANCGACGRACAGGQACVAGACETLASCAAIHAARPSLPSGAYLIDPDGVGAVAAFTVVCDMETAGGGWTLGFLKNSAHQGNYGNFGAAYTTVSALATTPVVASSSATGTAGWVDLNAFPYTTLRLAGYQNGSRTYLSNDILRSSLRIAFGQPGYLLYGDSNGYYWCGGPASYTDSGSGQVNRPAGAPADCKGHGSLGDGWDFSTSTDVNRGLTLCGANASNWMYGVYGSGTFIFYPTPGAAYAIWVR